MHDDNINVDEEVVEQLTGVADTMAKLLDQVMERHDHQTKDMDYFREDLGRIRDSIRHIAKVLHEGNGEKPLIARVAINENEIKHITGVITKLELAAHEKERLEEERKNIDQKGRWGLRVAVVSGITALVVEIFRFFGG